MDGEIGYGRPPVATRFQKGRSGNPGGRPGPRRLAERKLRKALNDAVETDPLEFLDRKAPTKTDALADALVLRAGLGDADALRQVYKTVLRRGGRGRMPTRLRRALDTAERADAFRIS